MTLVGAFSWVASRLSIHLDLAPLVMNAKGIEPWREHLYYPSRTGSSNKKVVTSRVICKKGL